MGLRAEDLFGAFLVILWCTLHSMLIGRRVTTYMKEKLGEKYRFYRIFFNIVALVTFIPLVFYLRSIRGMPILRWEGPLVLVKYLFLGTGIYLFLAGARHYNILQFLGIRQINTVEVIPSLSAGKTFDTSGILGVIRHPWYVGGILIFWARDMALSTFLNIIIITAYFVIGAFVEERKLLHEFGEQYRKYQDEVSMFIPHKWLRGKMGRAR